MKKLMGKLKGMDYKQLLIQHGEKIGLGLVGLIALSALATTPWFGFPKSKEELKTLAAKFQKNLVESTWPDEKRQEFGPSDYFQQAQFLYTPLPVEPYAYRTPFSSRLYATKERIKEANYLPVESMIATAGRAVIAIGPPVDPATELLTADAESEDARPAVNSPIDEDNFVRNPVGTNNGIPGPGTGTGAVPPAGPTTGVPLPGETGPMGMADAQPTTMGEGIRYVAIRGIFPLQKQIRALARSMHAENVSDVADLFEILDFRLERQKAIAGADPWTGKWEAVDIQVAKDVLNSAADFDTDVVEPGAIDPVMTMPLPIRIMGIWGSRGTHPVLKRLSREEMEEQRRLNEAVVAESQELGLDGKPVAARKGFATLQLDIKDIRQEVMRNAPMDSMMRRVQSMPSPGVTSMPQPGMMNAANFQARFNTASSVLLFRYLDFDVEPGEAYRYRVKLIVKNPNFDRAPEEVTDLSVIKEPERETPWSEPTPPVAVEPDFEFYLVDVDHRKGRNHGSAELAIYQWNQKLGTYIDGVLTTPFGQFVGGKAKSWTLDVAKPSLEETEVDFSTREIFVDSYVSPLIMASDHPDLNLATTMKTRPVPVGVADQALVLNRYGELVSLDSMTSESGRASAEARVLRERKPFEELKNKGDETEPGGDRLEAAMNQMAMPSPTDTNQGRGRRGNPIRRGGKRSQ